MPMPHVSLGKFKIAPFKDPALQPYGAFANTTPSGAYPIKQTVMLDGKPREFVWPSSEHAYHAQKILHLKNTLGDKHPAQKTLTLMLNEIEKTYAGTGKEYRPREDYAPLVNKYLNQLKADGLNLTDKNSFDALCEADFHATLNKNGKKKGIDFMRTVISLKLQQHSELRKIAMQCAREGVLPVEISNKDVNWATGPNGEGLNMLGIIILEEGNKLLRQNGETPRIPNPAQAFQELQRDHSASLAHSVQVKNLTLGGTNQVPPRASRGNFVFKGGDHYVAPILSASEIENSLKKGTIPLVSNKETIFDGCLKLGINKTQASNLLATYSVKSVMGNLDTSVNVQMVNNSRANQKGHDPQAMKIKFSSQKEAQEFCQRLYKDYGIHSHTHGPGKMKTPQNGSVFLTKNDLDKLAQSSQLSKQPGVGKSAYDTLAKSFVDNTPAPVADKKAAHSAGMRSR